MLQTILNNIENGVEFSVNTEIYRLGRFGILRNTEKVTRDVSFRKGILSFGDYAFYILYSEERKPVEFLKMWGIC